MVIKEIDNLTTQEALYYYLEYLKILQDGRAKPDKSGTGFIRESVYNIEEIEIIKNKVNTILDISPQKFKKDPLDMEITYPKTNKHYKY